MTATRSITQVMEGLRAVRARETTQRDMTPPTRRRPTSVAQVMDDHRTTREEGK